MRFLIRQIPACLLVGGVYTNYTQTLGDHIYSLTSDAKGFTGSVQQQQAATAAVESQATRAARYQLLFECSAGVRVITTLHHSGVHPATKVIAIVGIDDIDHQDVHCTLYNSKGSAYDGKEAVGVKVSLASVKPNEVWHWPDGYGAPAQLQRAAKFVRPHP